MPRYGGSETIDCAGEDHVLVRIPSNAAVLDMLWRMGDETRKSQGSSSSLIAAFSI